MIKSSKLRVSSTHKHKRFKKLRRKWGLLSFKAAKSKRNANSFRRVKSLIIRSKRTFRANILS